MTVQKFTTFKEHFYSFMPPHTRGRIAVKIVEAKLTKNYGLPGVRMDPYVRVRIGRIFIFLMISIFFILKSFRQHAL